ncbi:hypothetical protein AMAG_04810 [Allomyces macrogynus ATCC 38327]|uniref:F-box domain-containing protein n=1 Tax=Allomyces macrogynus (strain ATCC 38327) TaxID=578462 RepID=A0A0L0S6L7_ALLM3|nr:hypothetical protein AMAG_04810 [Allomyces macrogynus ATCC 38327]|eukprot:KNE57979.1 hypothetical protein AMAG_04810 [Allomyces macrogynus ATCC 38327]
MMATVPTDRASADALPTSRPPASSASASSSPHAAPAGRVTAAILPGDVLATIFDHVSARSLDQLLRCRGVNKHWKSVVEGAHMNALYRSLLTKWGASTTVNPRARKFNTLFSLVLKEYRAGRCCVCLQHTKAKNLVAGRLYGPKTDDPSCITCRVKVVLNAIAMRKKDPKCFNALPSRPLQFVHEDTPLHKKVLRTVLHLPEKLVNQLPYYPEINPHNPHGAPMRIFDQDVVEKILFAVTGHKDTIQVDYESSAR